MHLYNHVVFYVEMLPCAFLQTYTPGTLWLLKKKMNCSTCFAIKRDVSNVASCSVYTWWTCIFTVIKIVKMYYGTGMQIIDIVWMIYVGFWSDCICTLSYNQIFLNIIANVISTSITSKNMFLFSETWVHSKWSGYQRRGAFYHQQLEKSSR